MEDQFDNMIRERLEKAALDPPARAWDRLNNRMNPPSSARLVWARLAAGLLVAGLAAAYFIREDKTPQEVATVMLTAPAPEPGPQSIQQKKREPAANAVKLGTMQNAEAGTPDPVITSKLNEQSSDLDVQVVEVVSEETPPVVDAEEESDLNVEGVVLVYELPVDVAREQLINDRPVRTGLARFVRLVREVKNGEASLGHVRDLKNSLFTRDFWKEKISKNTNQTMQ
ncbi:MAG: hypothetical protein ACKO3B_11945 [Bacteroidota bacterium]